MLKPDLQKSLVVDQMANESRGGVDLSVESSCLHSIALFGKKREVLIEHAGFTYRLRITQANKLILTK